MNTKLILLSSSIRFFVLGVILTFIPDVLIGFLELSLNMTSLLLFQILGALYFAFAMLNGMSKANLIGGIYNRPIVMAKLFYFMIVVLSVVKGLLAKPDLHFIIWFIAVFNVIYGLIFGILLLRHPIKERRESNVFY